MRNELECQRPDFTERDGETHAGAACEKGDDGADRGALWKRREGLGLVARLCTHLDDANARCAADPCACGEARHRAKLHAEGCAKEEAPSWLTTCAARWTEGLTERAVFIDAHLAAWLACAFKLGEASLTRWLYGRGGRAKHGLRIDLHRDDQRDGVHQPRAGLAFQRA